MTTCGHCGGQVTTIGFERKCAQCNHRPDEAIARDWRGVVPAGDMTVQQLQETIRFCEIAATGKWRSKEATDAGILRMCIPTAEQREAAIG